METRIFINHTPYHISYKKGPSIPKGNSFEVDGEFCILDVHVWYGNKWQYRIELAVESNTIVFRKILPGESEKLSHFSMATAAASTRSPSYIGNLFKRKI